MFTEKDNDTVLVRVRKSDLRLMRTVCLLLYCDEYPEKSDKKVTDAELFSSLVKFYQTSS